MKNLLLKTKQRLFLVFTLVFALGISIQLQAQTITEGFEETEWITATTTNSTMSTITVGGVASNTWIVCSAFAQTNTSYVKTGSKSLFFGGGSKAILITPVFPNGVTTISLVGKANGNNGTLGVFYATNTNMATWTNTGSFTSAGGPWIAGTTFSMAASSNWYSSTLDMGAIAGTNSTKSMLIRFQRLASSPSIDDIEITTPVSGPTASLKSGSTKDLTVMQTTTDDIVYTLGGTATQYSIAWTKDASPITPDFIADSQSGNDVTLSIAPTGTTEIGDYVYTLTPSDGTTDGTAVTGTVSIATYTTPAPVFSSPSNKSQAVKPGTAITDIAFTIQHAQGATLDGLPDTFTGVYNNGTFTISGTPGTETTYPAIYNYTVTATPLDGYTGDAVTATGIITIKDPNAKIVAYVVNTNVSANDTQILSALQALYEVTTVKIADVTTSYDFSPYDVVVLTEAPSSGSTGMKALWGIDKPLLNLKAFAVQSNTWNFGTASENTGTRQNIKVVQSTHPIFANVTLDNDTLVMLSGVGSSEKGLQTVSFGTNNVNNRGITLAHLTTSSTAISIYEIKSGVDANGTSTSVTGVKNEALQNKFIQIGIADISANNLSDDGLKIVKNAVAYLMSSEVFKNTEAKILTMTIGGSAATIDQTAKTATVDLLQGTELTALNVSLTLSAGATLTAPASLTGVDFTNPVTFTVQAEDETVSPVNYTVTVTANKPTSINNTTNINTKVAAVGSAIVVNGAIGAKVKVVTIAGATLYQGVLSSTEEVLPVTLKTGVYAVLINGVATKLLVK